MASIDDLRAHHAAVMAMIEEHWQAQRTGEARDQFNAHVVATARELNEWVVTRDRFVELIADAGPGATIVDIERSAQAHLDAQQDILASLIQVRSRYFEPT